jgi:preprotein translocase subunit YajC
VVSVEAVVLGPAGPGWCARNCGKVDMTVWSVMTGLGQLALLMQATGQPGGFTLFLPLILIMVIFYFLMIMPAQRRQKKVAQMLKELKTGDKVITNGGIYGTITGLEDDAVQLRIAEQVKIKISRSAIAGIQPDQKESS